MISDDRSVSPVVGVVLVVAITVMLAAVVALFAFGMTDETEEAGPYAGIQMDGTISIAGTAAGCAEEHVELTHQGGDAIPIENIEIIVRLDSGSDSQESRIHPPVSGYPDVEKYEDLIDQNHVSSDCWQGIITQSGEEWRAGKKLSFRVNNGNVGYDHTIEKGDTIEVTVVDEEANKILGEVSLEPQSVD